MSGLKNLVLDTLTSSYEKEWAKVKSGLWLLADDCEQQEVISDTLQSAVHV